MGKAETGGSRLAMRRVGWRRVTAVHRKRERERGEGGRGGVVEQETLGRKRLSSSVCRSVCSALLVRAPCRGWPPSKFC